MTQFSDVLFYRFLTRIGLMPNKPKLIGEIQVPRQYFFGFLCGFFDGDGCTYSYFDSRWRSSYKFYMNFVSASSEHIDWLRREFHRKVGILGHVTKQKDRALQQLKYTKKDSLKLLRKMYYSKDVVYSSRKRLKIQKMLAIVGEQL